MSVAVVDFEVAVSDLYDIVVPIDDEIECEEPGFECEEC